MISKATRRGCVLSYSELTLAVTLAVKLMFPHHLSVWFLYSNFQNHSEPVKKPYIFFRCCTIPLLICNKGRQILSVELLSMAEAWLRLLHETVPQVLSHSPVKYMYKAYAIDTCHILPYSVMTIAVNALCYSNGLWSRPELWQEELGW